MTPPLTPLPAVADLAETLVALKAFRHEILSGVFDEDVARLDAVAVAVRLSQIIKNATPQIPRPKRN